MTERRVLFAALCLSGVALVNGCDTNNTPPGTDAGSGTDGGGTDGGPPVDGGGGGTDAGTMGSPQLTYTPEGCGYPVSTPTVIDAARSSDVFGAAPAPDHVHVSWAGPTDTTFAVNWHTDNDTLASSLLIGTDMAAVMAADGAATGVDRHDGHTILYSALATGASPSRVHEVHVCGLTPGTTYYYRVGGPGHWSDVFDVATGPAVGSADAWSFGVTGDSRNMEDNAWAIANHRLSDRGVDFEVFTGDAVLTGGAQSLWDMFFTETDGTFAVQDFFARRPLMMSNGNHDNLAVNYLVQFALPQDAPMQEIPSGEEWYSFDYANAHFVVLNDTVVNSATIAGAEATWLEADLAAVDRARTPWIFAVHHQSIYTCGSTHSPDTTARAAWQPIFDRYHVDFVLAGHNHVYERSQPVFGNDMVAPAVATDGAPVITGGVPSGTVYIVAGGAGAPLYPVATTCPTARVGVMSRNYVTFSISGRSLHMQAYDSLTNAMIDEITYTK